MEELYTKRTEFLRSDGSNAMERQATSPQEDITNIIFIKRRREIVQKYIPDFEETNCPRCGARRLLSYDDDDMGSSGATIVFMVSALCGAVMGALITLAILKIRALGGI